MSDRFSLAGKVALVTGASRGMGAAIAQAYAEHGARVAIIARTQQGVDDFAAQLRSQGHEVLAIAADISIAQDRARIVDSIMASWGRIDVVVNGAGANPYFGPLLGIDEKSWDRTMEVNIKAPFELTRLAVEAWMGDHGGSVIMMASIAGIKAAPLLGVYGVTKAALIMLTRALAQELGPQGVRVNALAPGVVKTRFARALWETEEIAEVVLRTIPVGRFGQSEEVVGAALLLGSEAGSYLNGAVLVIDGGATI